LVRALFAVLVLAGVLLLGGGGPAAAAPRPNRAEYVGVEQQPLWLTSTETPRFGGPGPGRLSLGLVGSVRIFRQAGALAYFTPLQISAGLPGSGVGQDVLLAALSTEVGTRLGAGALNRIEVGAALGLGGLLIPYGQACDGPCWLGGGLVLASPVVRYFVKDDTRWSVALVARGFIPVRTPAFATLDGGHGFGAITVFGAEVAFRRR
jgi:hypothetical protein